MNSDLLQQVIADQAKALERRNPGITRRVNFDKHLKSSQISVITGIRRSGKSTFMLQLARRYNDFHYFSFDDERLISFGVEDFNTLLISLKKLKDARVIVIDEVQLVPGWERFVRRIYDEGYKVIVSGSNAKLLASELATHLTGRYILTEMYPFSFREMLDLRKIDPDDRSTENLGAVLRAFDQFLETGGFPEYLITGEKEYLKRIYDDILFRDLISRYGIRNVHNFRNLSQYLFTNFTSEFGYLPLAKLLDLSSANVVREYIHYLSQAYLLFELNRFDYSLKKQYVTAKKIYTADNGLRNAIAFRTSLDQGRLLENLVYIELRRRNRQVWFFRTRNNLETDFVTDPARPGLIQVCFDMSQPGTRKREVESLLASMEELNVDQALILTYGQEEEIMVGNRIIRILPAWKWLIEIP